MAIAYATPINYQPLERGSVSTPEPDEKWVNRRDRELSECESNHRKAYRRTLQHHWKIGGDLVVVIGLNHEQNDDNFEKVNHNSNVT